MPSGSVAPPRSTSVNLTMAKNWQDKQDILSFWFAPRCTAVCLFVLAGPLIWPVKNCIYTGSSFHWKWPTSQVGFFISNSNNVPKVISSFYEYLQFCPFTIKWIYQELIPDVELIELYIISCVLHSLGPHKCIYFHATQFLEAPEFCGFGCFSMSSENKLLEIGRNNAVFSI